MSKISIGKILFIGGVSLGTILVSLSSRLEVNAEEIRYDGTVDNILKTDLSGDSNPFKSLYSTSSLSDNKVIVGSEIGDGKAEWATTGIINAPYVIYGGIDIRPNTRSEDDPVEPGLDISNNAVHIKNVQYDWSGKNSVGGGLSIDGSNANGGGFGGGSIFGGVSVGAAARQGEGTHAGGNGGIVNSNKVTLQNLNITGSNGGNGIAGNMAGTQNGALGGGIGGQGGGSVFGGLSIGGSGTLKIPYSGAGGEVYHNEVSLNGVVLKGGAGGKGGESLNGLVAGGAGGSGGASVFGGFSIGGAGGDNPDNLINGSGGNVHDNKITLTNVTLHGGIGGNGGASNGGGAGHGGIGGGSVVGGASFGGSTSYSIFSDVHSACGGIVSNNHITLTNVTLFGGAGGQGGKNLGANEAGFGHDGLAGGTVVGGLSVGGSGLDYGGNGGDINGNSIKISGKSLIWGSVYGGYSFGGKNATDSNPDNIGLGGKTNNNIVTLEGSNIKIGERDEGGNVTSYGSIWGGRSVNGDGSDNTDFDRVISGNTLNLDGYRGIVAGIYNFENYNWILPNDVKNGDVLVTIAEGGTAVNLTNTIHTVTMYNDGSRLNGGDVVTMINKTAGAFDERNYQISQGSFILYDAILKQQVKGDKPLVLVIQDKIDSSPTDNGEATSPIENGGSNHEDDKLPMDKPSHSAAKLNPQSKSYAEGRAAALGFVSQGSDLIATAGMDHIRIMVRSNEKELNYYGFVPFMIANGASQRYNTGSHVDIDGFNMAVGLATGFEFASGHKTTIGAFFEYGRGTYDTYNSFTNFFSVKSDGDTDYKGGGIFGRVDFAGTGLGYVKNLAADQADGLYIEASLRAGRASSEFDVGRNFSMFSNIKDSYRGSYDSDVTYFGGHVAGGYVLNFDDRQSVDVYGRYLWTRMDSDNVSVSYEKLHFDSSLSSRIQIGGRYSYAYSDQFKPYFGASYEYEFDGDVKAKAYEFNLERPSLEGSTGIFEAGFSLKPVAKNQALSIDVNGQGYVGQRQGGGGGIKLKYQF